MLTPIDTESVYRSLPRRRHVDEYSAAAAKALADVRHMHRYMTHHYPYLLLERFFRISSRRDVALVSHAGKYRHVNYIVATGTLRRLFKEASVAFAVALHLGPATDLRDIFRDEAYEVVFDIDLNDYANVRVKRPGMRHGLLCTCGDTKTACGECWTLLALADVVLRWVFTDRLQLGTPLWVYSGGKGGHCIFGNPTARSLGPAARHAIVQELVRWQTPSEVDVMACDPEWMPLCEQLQSRLRTIASTRPRLLCSPVARQWLASFMAGDDSGEVRDTYLNAPAMGDTAGEWRLFCGAASPANVRRALLELALPVVDLGPLRNTKPLIKLPFSVHPRSRKISLPVDMGESRCAFEPATMPSPADLDLATDGGRVPAVPAAYTRGLSILECWLDANEYPRVETQVYQF